MPRTGEILPEQTHTEKKESTTGIHICLIVRRRLVNAIYYQDVN
jgi:hypothetical protein